MANRKTAIFVIALAGAAIPSMAAAPTATAPAWAVNRNTSTLSFTGAAQGTPFTGAFGSWDAQILFDPANLGASQATVTVQTASAKTGDADKDGPLQEESWLATQMFPQATFKTTSIKSAGTNSYVADGTLTIRDVSQPVSLPFDLTITGNDAHMTGALKLDRATFHLGEGAFQDHSVDPQVTVNIDLTAHKAG